MMTEPRSDDRAQARREAAALLAVDIEHLSPADNLRVDMVSALRLVIDSEQASILSGGSADLQKLNVAVASLIALLPGSKLDEPASSRPDPRKAMLETYLGMRRRGALAGEGLDGAKLRIERLQAELAAKDAELAALRAGVPAPSTATPLPDNVVPLARRAGDAGDSFPRVVPRSDPPKPAPAAPAAGILTDDEDQLWRPFVSGGAYYDRWGNHT
jgi:hypothetical protein